MCVSPTTNRFSLRLGFEVRLFGVLNDVFFRSRGAVCSYRRKGLFLINSKPDSCWLLHLGMRAN
jgi:hypothetical protein